ncbi:peroxiredoxin [Psychroflexus maritimus]|uniref:thioredoxin-dependent peroxiredoxin n=1 Tax=Psychroflexus maritimus TaxID=2714865 RepID=A0A967AJM9_9FLAO|nr:peroxiredoxin [Psychroflexus maritimus]NGZ89594.1 peroxiredoxin [Psychroflexus maritimus]
MTLSIGDIVPNFKSKNQDGEEFNSAEIIGKKPVVIFFYPKDFTPGCTKEACNFRDAYKDFQDYGAEVIGISGDSEKSHQRFAKKHQLPYTLLSDSSGKIRKKFGVKKSLLGLVPGRETFVLDKNGMLQMRFNNLDANRHMKKALQKIKELN